MFIKHLPVLGAVLGSLGLAACDLDIPDLNNPGLDELESNPTKTIVNSAATGLLVGNRVAKATTTGFVNQLGILGRESYDFDVSDSRFTTELLQGPLIKNDAFGGVFWAQPYANIRLGHLVLHGVDKVTDFSEDEKNAIRGFTHTIQALDYMTVILTHDVTGAVIDTDRPVGELGDFVSKDAVYAEIARLLDQGKAELISSGKGGFPFALSPGFAGFDTPETFLKFNRAIRARIAVYQKDYKTAADLLTSTETFIADTGDINFNLGVFYVYSVAVGDTTNNLTNPAIGAHPSLETDAKQQPPDPQNPGAPRLLDARYLAKVTAILDEDKKPTTLPGPTGSGVSTSIKFKLYASPTASIPVIRNEELILLKAEALYFSQRPTEARNELNLVRVNSGKLDPLTETDITNDETFVNALLHERRYSLMFEGGHRWIDLRRFDIKLPLDVAMDSADGKVFAHVRNVHYPVPLAECDARPPGLQACTLSSIDDTP